MTVTWMPRSSSARIWFSMKVSDKDGKRSTRMAILIDSPPHLYVAASVGLGSAYRSPTQPIPGSSDLVSEAPPGRVGKYIVTLWLYWGVDSVIVILNVT